MQQLPLQLQLHRAGACRIAIHYRHDNIPKRAADRA